MEENNALILIVDDTPKNIQVLGTILKQEGYRINVAQNGVQALEVVDKISPDLILLDVMMPEMDGFQTCKRLKSSPHTEGIPIIFLTAKTETEDIVKGFNLGAVDFISKPFNSTELLVRVRTHLELKFSKELIEQVSNERKELLHVLCHDLANPFISIRVFLDLISDWEQFESMKPYLFSAANQGLGVIDLVRKMRVIEEYRLEPEELNLAESISESIALLGGRFNEKQIEVKMDVDENITIFAERTSFINSVLNNIITNAIKFSEPGSSIVLNARKRRDDVELSIRDYGIGMPKELLESVFDLSKATNRPGTKGEEGTGFGMPLVKKFIKAYGGSIEVMSKERGEPRNDHGTLVTIKLKPSDMDLS